MKKRKLKFYNQIQKFYKINVINKKCKKNKLNIFPKPFINPLQNPKLLPQNKNILPQSAQILKILQNLLTLKIHCLLQNKKLKFPNFPSQPQKLPLTILLPHLQKPPLPNSFFQTQKQNPLISQKNKIKRRKPKNAFSSQISSFVDQNT